MAACTRFSRTVVIVAIAAAAVAVAAAATGGVGMGQERLAVIAATLVNMGCYHGMMQSLVAFRAYTIIIITSVPSTAGCWCEYAFSLPRQISFLA
jgi:hypothetical protein